MSYQNARVALLRQSFIDGPLPSEPIHGSAPILQGGIANPISMILSVAKDVEG